MRKEILEIGRQNDKSSIPRLRQQLAKIRSTPFNPLRAWVHTGEDGREHPIEAALQMALAKLGDEVEFDAIVSELEGDFWYRAIQKVRYIGGNRVVPHLIPLLDRRKQEMRGGVGYPSPAYMAVLSLSEIITPPPAGIDDLARFGDDLFCGTKTAYEKWEEWWEANKSRYGIKSEEVPAEHSLASLRQRIEMGETDAILEVGEANIKALEPVLRKILKSGRPTYNTPAGFAQVALTQLGDEDQYDSIISEIKSTNPVEQHSGIWKLSRIGGQESIRILGHLLHDGVGYWHDKKVETWGLQRRLKAPYLYESRASLAAKALSSIVPDSPVKCQQLVKHSFILFWQQWWKENQSQYFPSDFVGSDPNRYSELVFPKFPPRMLPKEEK